MKHAHTFHGTVYRQKDGSGILVDDVHLEEYNIDLEDMSYLMHQDIVKARLIDSKHHQRLQIIEVIKRAHRVVLGQVIYENDWIFVPEDKKIATEFLLDEQQVYDFQQSQGLNSGDMVYARIVEFADAYRPNIVQIDSVLGPLDNPGIEIEMAVAKYDLPHVFSGQTQHEVDQLPHTPHQKDYKDRIDLRDLNFATIDGADARDFDDAVFAAPYFDEENNQNSDQTSNQSSDQILDETKNLENIKKSKQAWIDGQTAIYLANQPKKRGAKSKSEKAAWDAFLLDITAQADDLFKPNQQASHIPANTKKWRLLVAIADVANYVKPDTALDLDAITRATSVYFPRKVIPMLPEKLSNGLCSLNPHVDRLVMVCDMVIDSDGEIEAYQFYEAVIHSKARLTYDEVWDYLSTKQINPNIAGVLEDIHHLYDVFLNLLDARKNRGAIDFESQEMQIVCNDSGKIEKIVPKTRNQAHQLIEECMLAANVCAADFISQQELGIYRIHDRPQIDKIQQLRQYLQGLGLANTISLEPKPAEIAALSAKIKNRPDVQTIQTMILRSMAQAIYHPENIGHYGLAYGAYTHFTSPIRRYPDLLVHRLIKSLLQQKNYVLQLNDKVREQMQQSAKSAQEREHRNHKPKQNAQNTQSNQHSNGSNNSSSSKNKQFNVQAPKNLSKHEKSWYDIGQHTSFTERRADEASKDVQAWLKAYFMSDKVGEVFAGKISSVTQFGIFVLLDEMWIEGLIHISVLGNEYFMYQEQRQEIVGQQSGRTFKAGQAISIQVAKVDVIARKIDFVLSDGLNNKNNNNGNNANNSNNKANKNKRGKIAAPLETPTKKKSNDFSDDMSYLNDYAQAPTIKKLNVEAQGKNQNPNHSHQHPHQKGNTNSGGKSNANSNGNGANNNNNSSKKPKPSKKAKTHAKNKA